MFLASLVFIVSTVIGREKLISVETGASGEDALFTGILNPTKGVSGLPGSLKNRDIAFQVTSDDHREPASINPNSKQKVKSKSVHWTDSTTDGFEFKIRIKQQVSAVWVMKRNDHYDLIFANNNGSRVNLTIPAEQFYALKNAATDLRAPASDLSNCKDQFIQLEMVETNSRKMVSTCLNTKSKPADELRRFGSALTAYVR